MRWNWALLKSLTKLALISTQVIICPYHWLSSDFYFLIYFILENVNLILLYKSFVSLNLLQGWLLFLVQNITILSCLVSFRRLPVFLFTVALPKVKFMTGCFRCSTFHWNQTFYFFTTCESQTINIMLSKKIRHKKVQDKEKIDTIN